MSTYCTVRDVRIALTPNGVESEVDRPETAAGLPDWQIEDAILEAEGTVNAYLASRYVITPVEVEELNPDDPMETWVYMVAPSPIRAWTRDVAAYLAALTFRKNKDLTEDDPIRLRYRYAVDMLTATRNRQNDLPLPGTDSDDQGVAVENLYEGSLFGMEDVGLGYGNRDPQYLWPGRRW